MKKNLLILNVLTGKLKYFGVVLLSLALFSTMSYASNTEFNSPLLQIIKEVKISINLKNTPLDEILTQITKKAKIGYAYQNNLVNKNQSFSLTCNNITVEEALNRLFNGSEYAYSLKDDIILVSSKKTIQPQPKNNQPKLSIKGKILDEKGNPVAGATIIVAGTNDGAISDDKGEFTIKASKDAVIDVTFIGMADLKYTITKDESNLIIKMKESGIEIEEVIVTGMFERRAGSFTGSATTLKADDLKRVGNTNVFASLKNLDPSLMIFDNLSYGSDPNKNPEMMLRGTSSFGTGSSNLDIKGTYRNDPNAPLFILDGFEASIQKIMDLDMNRVETLTILKDASAKAIYGSKAGNGVIVIETKKSSTSDLRLTYTGTVDIQAPDLTSYNLTNARQKLEIEKDAGLYEDPRGSLSNYIQLQDDYNRKLSAVVSGVDTDWLAKPLHTGIGNKHFIQFEMGNNLLRLAADFSYNNIKGVMKGSDRTTYSGNINISYRHKKFLFRNILSVNSNIAKESPYGQFNEYSIINPYYSPIDATGRLLQNAALSTGPLVNNNLFIDNPLYNASLNNKNEKRYIDFTNNLYVEWTILQGLKATGRMGITEKRDNGDIFFPSNHLKFRTFTGNEQFRKGTYETFTGISKHLTGDLNVQYTKTFNNKHYVFGNAGFTIDESSYQEVSYLAEGFPNDKMNNIMFAKQYAKEGKPSGSEATVRNVGVLGAFNYSYDSRYLFDASYRTNASSQFGANSRWGEFWSLGLGWNMHNESFLKNIDAINNFKIRGSVGQTGTQSGAAYGAMATYIYTENRTYRNMLGAYLKGMRNEDLKWEQKFDMNVGFDLNINRRFMLTFDYYIGVTNNTLIDLTLPPSLGFTSMTENVGNVENRGFDIRANYTVWQRPKDDSYLTFTVNISRNKNTIKGVSDAMKSFNESQNAQASDIFSNRPIKKYLDGGSMNDIWAMRSRGIDPANGREIYLTKDGIPTYVFSASQMVIMGNDLPKFHGTAGANFQYKGFGLNLSFLYQYGAQKYNETVLNQVENANLSNNVDKRVFDGRWRKPGDVKPYKSLGKYWDNETGTYIDYKTQNSSRFVQNRNEFSLSNVSIDYDFKNFSFVKSIGMERLKVAFYMRDVFMLSSIKMERGTFYPFARGFNFSVTAVF